MRKVIRLRISKMTYEDYKNAAKDRFLNLIALFAYVNVTPTRST